MQSQKNPRRLLVVDDSLMNRKLLMRLLCARSFLCEEAADGQEAIGVYEAARDAGRPFDAVLLDNQMPVMDGPTCVQKLRAIGCRCLVVGVTGNVMQADVDDFVQHGADRVFGKPLDTDAFESLLATHFHPI
jgi:CheY-like chemotaxis protein